MKNIIFLAMSVLPDTIRIFDFSAPCGRVILDCQSQLESVVRYILTRCEGQDVTVLSMATEPTRKRRIINDVQETNKDGKCSRTRKTEELEKNNSPSEVEYQSKYINTSIGFFIDRIQSSPEIKIPASCNFEDFDIDLNRPEEAIQKSVEQIRKIQGTDGETVNLWIDTHGGLRDVALLINVVGYLLNEFTNLTIAGVYGTEMNDHLILDQRNAFYSLSFVSGMSDFMNFGNVDVLKKYYDTEISGGDAEIQELIAAMQLVSDGTQFCDPYLYKEGLDALSKVVKNHDHKSGSSKSALLPIFYDSIILDYGNLLDTEKRTSLDIIERCYKKKQYQQALTFIEALMPQYFFDKKILYFSDEELGKAKQVHKDSYKPAVNIVFENFLESQRKLVKNDGDDRNTLPVAAAMLAGVAHVDELPEDIQKDIKKELKRSNDLTKGMRTNLRIHKEVSLGDRERTTIQYQTRLEGEALPEVRKILQMHYVLKSSRNKFNHAVESDSKLPLKDRRPSLRDIVSVMEKYIDAIRKLEKTLDEQSW